jgi:hypothetical protein
LISVPERANQPPDRLKEGQQVAGEIERAGPGAPASGPLQLIAGTEWYFCERELGEKFSKIPTPEEIAAGFD